VIEKRHVDAKAGKTPGITTGGKRLDSLTGGWRGDKLIIIGGRPGHGKSSMAIHFATVAARQGIPVIFFSLEMKKSDVAEIMLIGQSGISRTAIYNGKIQDSDYTLLHSAAGQLEGLEILFYDNPDLTINQMSGIVKSQIRKRGKCLVVIDYLQLIRPEKTTNGQTRDQQIGENTRALKRLAQSEDIPVILLSQLNRNGETEEPKLIHLRESGSIEQDSDIVLFVWKPAKDGYESSENLIRVKVAKNRNGRLGTLDIHENGQMTKFSECPFETSFNNQRSTVTNYNPDERITSVTDQPF
jgi:replicative DNA helicase